MSLKCFSRSRQPGTPGRGQGLAEFAIVLPMILLLILGIIEAGRLLTIYSSVSSAAKQASRYGSVAGDSGGGLPYYLDCQGMRQQARSRALFVGLNDTDINIRYDRGTLTSTVGLCPTGAISPTLSEPIRDGYRVVISITATYNPILPIVPVSNMPMTFSAARTIFTLIVGPTATTRPNPDLVLAKTDSRDPVLPGSVFSYTLQVTKPGLQDAASVAKWLVVTDTLPAGVSFISAPLGDPATGLSWACAPLPNAASATRVVCTLSTLMAAVAEPITITVRAPTTPGTINNVADLTYFREDPDPGDNHAEQPTYVMTATDLEIGTMDQPDPVAAYNPLTYTITITNHGSVASGPITVTANLPANTSSPTGAGSGWVCTPALGTVQCTRNASLPVGGVAPPILMSLRAPLPVLLPPGGIMQAQITARTNYTDPVQGNSTNVPITTTVFADADLVVAKTDAPDPVAPDQPVNYTIRVTNLGPSLVQTGTIQVTDVYTGHAAFVSASGTDWTCNSPTAPDPVVCTLNRGLMANQVSPDLTVVLRAPASEGATLQNTAMVSAPQPDPDPGNNVDTEPTGTLNCTPGQISVANSNFYATQSVLPHDGGTLVGTLRAEVKDDCNEPMSGVPVTIERTSGSVGTVNPASGTTDAAGVFEPRAYSNDGGAVTFRALVGAASIELGQHPTIQYVCASGDMTNSFSKDFEFRYINDTPQARWLDRVIVTFTQGGQQTLDLLWLPGSGINVWDGDAASGVDIGTGGSEPWIGGTDTARTFSPTEAKLVTYRFSKNLPGGNPNNPQTFTFQTFWRDTAGTGSVCSITTTISR